MTGMLLEVRNIEVDYGAVSAVRNVTLQVPQGSIVALLGANGAGKTTILRTISGILAPRSGLVLFKGKEIQRVKPDVIARLGISHVPEGREVFPLLTVAENLAMGSYSRRDKDGIKRDLQKVCEHFPVLTSRWNQPAGQMSGGEQQMLVIGRALMARPSLLLLDEPSLGLSPKLIKEVFKIIARINQEDGTTILLIEQNANVALAVASFGYVIEVGRLAMAGTADCLLQDDEINRVYLGTTRGDGKSQKRHPRVAWI